MVEQTDKTACRKGRCDYRRRSWDRPGDCSGVRPGGRIGLLALRGPEAEIEETVREIRGEGGTAGRVSCGRIGMGRMSRRCSISRNRSFPELHIAVLNAGVNVDHGLR